MSELAPSRTIPVGIFVSASDASRKRVRRLHQPVPWRPRVNRVPWRHVLIAASAVWTLCVLTVGILVAAAQPPAADRAALALVPAPVPSDEVEATPLLATPLLASLPAPVDMEEDSPLPAKIDPPRVPLAALVPAVKPPVIPKLPEADLGPAIPEAPAGPAVGGAKLGTPITFVAAPPDAFKLARQENKLVFMIHLSGNFEDKEFT
jgi:hypothetical protein